MEIGSEIVFGCLTMNLKNAACFCNNPASRELDSSHHVRTTCTYQVFLLDEERPVFANEDPFCTTFDTRAKWHRENLPEVISSPQPSSEPASESKIAKTGPKVVEVFLPNLFDAFFEKSPSHP